MTYAPEAHVDGAGIFGVNPPKGAGEGVRALRRGHQVNVIGPEAVAQDGDAMVTPTATSSGDMASKDRLLVSCSHYL
jgi:hypothetical protein